MRLYDTHCHFERADPTEIAAILSRAKAAGVEKLMAVGGSPALNESAALAAEVAHEALVAPKVCSAVGFDREQAGKDLRRETEDLRGLETLDFRPGLPSNVSRLRSLTCSLSNPTAQTTFGATSASFATSTASAADSLRAGDPPTAISFSTPAAFARERIAAISVGTARSKWQCVS